MASDETPVDQQLLDSQMRIEEILDGVDDECAREDIICAYLSDVLDNKRVTVDDFGLDLDWINVWRAISLHNDLNGLVVVIDFFTYCCINCLHILPHLSKIERDFENEGVVVIGIHSPKFDNEKDFSNVADSVLKYNIEHAVANDPIGSVWAKLSIQCWPTVLILGPNAELLFTLVGENGPRDWLNTYTKATLKYFQLKNMIQTTKKLSLPFKLLKNASSAQMLRFPGKITLSNNEQMLAISDTEHNRVIVSNTSGIIKFIVGGSKAGFKDGSLDEALFSHPQGMAWREDCFIYVADTHNHAIRLIDLNNKTVTTLAGNGRQSERVWREISDKVVELNSPWDVCYDGCDKLYIAMAGCHQIWVLCVQENTKILDKYYPKGSCVLFAGNGAELNRNNIYPLMASFAQPSGLALDSISNRLYIADSESSSIRYVDTITGSVNGLVGGHRNPRNLFAFGDFDGRGIECRLQHCLGVALSCDKQSLFVADSYNHKIKQIVVSSKECISIAGTGENKNKSDCSLMVCQFNEPNGLCVTSDNVIYVTDTNNHCIKRIDLQNDLVSEFRLINVSHVCNNSDIKGSSERDVDFSVKLDVINVNIGSKLKLIFDLKFNHEIKLNEDSKHKINLVFPVESPFFCVVTNFEVENSEKFPEIVLSIIKEKCVEPDSHHYIDVYTQFIICDNNLKLCKKIKIKFSLSVKINLDEELNDDKTVILPFYFT